MHCESVLPLIGTRVRVPDTGRLPMCSCFKLRNAAESYVGVQMSPPPNRLQIINLGAIVLTTVHVIVVSDLQLDMLLQPSEDFSRHALRVYRCLHERLPDLIKNWPAEIYVPANSKYNTVTDVLIGSPE